MSASRKLRGAFAIFLGLGILAWAGWGILRDVWGNPEDAVGYVCAFLIVSLPFTIRWTGWGRKYLTEKPETFWIIGGAMIAVAVVSLGCFIVLTMNDAPLPLDGRILGYSFALLFGAGFMILATPTIWTISNLAKPSKEK